MVAILLQTREDLQIVHPEEEITLQEMEITETRVTAEIQETAIP